MSPYGHRIDTTTGCERLSCAVKTCVWDGERVAIKQFLEHVRTEHGYRYCKGCQVYLEREEDDEEHHRSFHACAECGLYPFRTKQALNQHQCQY